MYSRFRKSIIFVLLIVIMSVPALSSVFAQDDTIIIGLITKTETNPFFVKMREGAQATADELGVELLTAAGQFDGDNAGQVTAIENMVAAGASGILITPSDTSAIVPAIEMAREAGVIVIALDTPTDPQDATDALYATDNFQAGVAIGQYAAAAMANPEEAQIALLNLLPGITVGELRRDGFLEGFGITLDSDQVVCQQDTQGDQTLGQTAMENCLVQNPEINLVYTINEPAAFGAYTALENAGLADGVMIVSVDGGCAGIEGVINGQIDATSQQYPLRMASLGVQNIVAAAQGGEFETGYTDTGVTLITGTPVDGVESEGLLFGYENCWGDQDPDVLAMVQDMSGDEEMDDMGMSMEDMAAAIGAIENEVIVGLITKTETNPFFVKMREGAQEAADALGMTLLTAAGQFDGDNASQVTAIENMIAAGASGILITPSDTAAIVPAIEQARAAGVVVIALDTPTDPQDATNALFATDNFQAGVAIGQYAAASMENPEDAQIALLNLLPGITVGELRRDGFLEGFGITLDSDQIVCQQDSQGDQTLGQTAMENCLVQNPEINLVYTINEPAAFGAYTALDNAGLADDVMIVSVDGGCAGVRGVVDGQIDATSQQYPLRMASLGVEAVAMYVITGVAPEGYTDTGVTLIASAAVDGVASEDVEFGLANCWGD
ncbi:MAG: substrate-binding domain-containing protein [Phototrophicaceae bacterium]